MFHRCRTLTANTEELECMALDVMFYLDLTVKKAMFRNSFHCKYKELILFIIAYFILHYPPYSVLNILFLKAATENYSLKQVLPKTK